MTQEFKSAGTSLRQIPALHKKVMENKLFGGTNFDNGAGKYMNATNYLAGNEVLNIRFDPFNLPGSAILPLPVCQRFRHGYCWP